MNFRVHVEREESGRWVAEVSGLPGVVAYGETAEQAQANAQALALRILADRLENGEATPFEIVAFVSFDFREHEILKRVDGPESFLEFARALAADRAASAAAEAASPSGPYGSDAGGWENTTIESFLEAAVAWAEDSSFGESQGLQGANPWRVFANFLYCGKIYE